MFGHTLLCSFGMNKMFNKFTSGASKFITISAVNVSHFKMRLQLCLKCTLHRPQTLKQVINDLAYFQSINHDEKSCIRLVPGVAHPEPVIILHSISC
jgi:hypothetical protein